MNRNIQLAEWSSADFPDLTLTPRDRQLATDLATQRRLVVEELRVGVRVRTLASVGMVQFEGFTIRITPKLAGDALGLARMLSFVGGIERLSRSAGLQPIEIGNTRDLLELLAHLLADESEQVVRRGMVADYAEHEEDLGSVRGRMLVDRQVLHRFGRVDRVICRFDELEHDTDDNRLLGLALQLCARRVRHEGLHRRLRYLAALFDEICSPGAMDLPSARLSMSSTRQNAHYRDAHALAWLILDAFGVTDVLAAVSPTRSFAFLLDMTSLFETFVWRLVEHLLPPSAYRVEPQERNTSVLWDPVKSRSYRSIRPDVVVRYPAVGRAIVIDAKYKRYDLTDVSSGDLYQCLIYALAYAGPRAAPVPNDHAGDDLRHAADRDGDGGGRWLPCADGASGDRRADHVDAADAAGGAGGVHLLRRLRGVHEAAVRIEGAGAGDEAGAPGGGSGAGAGIRGLKWAPMDRGYLPRFHAEGAQGAKGAKRSSLGHRGP